MPPRWACLAIVGLWLLVNGWVFYHDMLPHLLPGQPPAFTIDVLEEVQDRRWMRPVNWTVYQNGEKAMSAKLRVDLTARDTYELTAEYQPYGGRGRVSLHPLILVKKMTSTYRVNAAGDLLGVDFRLEGQPEPGALLRKAVPGDFTLAITGPVEGERFSPVARLSLASGQESELSLPGAPVRRGVAVVLPLHP